jgi:DNA-binding LytR/AlgR family response regulator
MIKCIVIDDEPVAIAILEEYIDKVEFLDLAGSFRDALKALEYLRVNRIDLVFLDINMPDISGIELLGSLDRRPLVVFTTAYSDYAVRSYDFEAVDYLVKPIEFERFLKAAGRALARFNAAGSAQKSKGDAGNGGDGGSILVKSGNDLHRLELDEILYVEGTGNYVTFVTNEKKIMSLITLKDVCKRLPADNFIRVHRSFIIAFNKIDVIKKDHLLIRKSRIPIGDVYRSELQRMIESHK